jgi:hypothetical protein
MKPDQTKNYAWVALALAFITLSSWKTGGSALPVKPFSLNSQADTTPSRKKDRKEYKIGDLDQAMKELDRAMVDMDKNMKIDMSKMDREIKAAMEEIKKIDFDKIGHEVEAELRKVNWDEANLEIKKAMREAQKEINEIDMKEIKKEIEKAQKEVSKEKISAHIDMQKIRESVNKGLAGARIGIEKAKKEISQLKEFTESLEKDGLINRKKGYKVEIKDNEMYINGTKQSKEVNEKYKKYFKEDNFVLRNDGEEISSL